MLMRTRTPAASSTKDSRATPQRNSTSLSAPYLIQVVSVYPGSDNHCEQPQAQQDTADQESIGIGRKRLVRNRTALKTKASAAPEPRDQKCANPNCLFVSKKDLGKLLKVKNPEYTGSFCAKCVEAIEKKWTCSFCRGIYTDDHRSAQVDQKTWIECENKPCGKWTHLDCEQDHRRQEDLTMYVNDSKQKFYCSECYDSCRDVLPPAETQPPASKKKSESISLSLVADQPPTQVPDQNTINDLRSCLKPTSKFDQLTNQQFFYLYSENYQPIGKLASESSLDSPRRPTAPPERTRAESRLRLHLQVDV